MLDEYRNHCEMSDVELRYREVQMRQLLREVGRAYGACKQELTEVVAEIARRGNDDDAEF